MDKKKFKDPLEAELDKLELKIEALMQKIPFEIN